MMVSSAVNRLKPQQLARRDQKIESRRLVKAQMIGQINLLGQYMDGFMRLSFWSKLRWFVLGPNYLNHKGTAILITAMLIIVALLVGIHIYR